MYKIGMCLLPSEMGNNSKGNHGTRQVSVSASGTLLCVAEVVHSTHIYIE